MPSRLLRSSRIVALCDTTITFSSGWRETISRITGSARASTATPDSPPSGANVKGSSSHCFVFADEPLLDLGARQPFPAAVADLAQAVARLDLQAARPG